MKMQEMLIKSHEVSVHQHSEVLLAGEELGHEAGEQRNEVSNGHHEGSVVELLSPVCLRIAC